jgi:hypothetical protein
MNLTKLGFSSWIIVLNIILLLTLLYLISTNRRDSFINYPEQVDPLAKPQKSSAPGAPEANNNYAALLMFIQKNPSNSINFIEDIKQKFFDDSCKVKSSIDFNNIAQMPNGMPFN